jgi:hypothetical protein
LPVANEKTATVDEKKFFNRQPEFHREFHYKEPASILFIDE